MTNTNIKFDKRMLESLKSSTKSTWYYAKNFEELALVVHKKKKNSIVLLATRIKKDLMTLAFP